MSHIIVSFKIRELTITIEIAITITITIAIAIAITKAIAITVRAPGARAWRPRRRPARRPPPGWPRPKMYLK